MLTSCAAELGGPPGSRVYGVLWCVWLMFDFLLFLLLGLQVFFLFDRGVVSFLFFAPCCSKFVVFLYVMLVTAWLFVIAVVLSGYRELVCGGVVTVL